MNIGFALCGSFCTFEKAFAAMAEVASIHTVTPIFSQAAYTIDSRFGTAQANFDRAAAICGRPPLHTIAQAEPIGPGKLLDALVIAPCTGNTLAKLAHSIADGPVTMAAKSPSFWRYPPMTPWPAQRKISESSWPGGTTILSPSGRMIPRENPPPSWQISASFFLRWKRHCQAGSFSPSWHNVAGVKFR